MCAKLNETNVTSKVFALNIIYMIQQQRKYIEKDPALERRFASVFVDEPNRSDTLAILR